MMYVFIDGVTVYWTRLTRTNSSLFCDHAENSKNNMDRGDVKSDIKKYIRDYIENDISFYSVYDKKWKKI